VTKGLKGLRRDSNNGGIIKDIDQRVADESRVLRGRIEKPNERKGEGER